MPEKLIVAATNLPNWPGQQDVRHHLVSQTKSYLTTYTTFHLKLIFVSKHNQELAKNILNQKSVKNSKPLIKVVLIQKNHIHLRKQKIICPLVLTSS